MLFMMLFRVCYVPGNVCTYVVRVSLERMVSSQALAHEDSHSPPVDGLRVGSPQQHLRLDVNRVPSLYRHVLLRSAVAVAAQLANRLILVQLDVVVARETKICQFDVSVCSQKHVLRLQISLSLNSPQIDYEDDAHGMKVFQSQNDLRHVESRSFFRKHTETRQVREQVAALHVVHHHVEAVGRLVGVVESRNEGEVGSLQNQSLHLGPRHLSSSHQLVLLENLHCVVAVCFGVVYVEDLSVSPSSQHRLYLEVVETDGSVRRLRWGY